MLNFLHLSHNCLKISPRFTQKFSSIFWNFLKKPPGIFLKFLKVLKDLLRIYCKLFYNFVKIFSKILKNIFIAPLCPPRPIAWLRHCTPWISLLKNANHEIESSFVKWKHIRKSCFVFDERARVIKNMFKRVWGKTWGPLRVKVRGNGRN